MMGDSGSVMRSWKGSGRCTFLSSVAMYGSARRFYKQEERRERDSRSGGENTHQLLVRPERSALFELDIELAELEEVAREGREVVRVVPLPRRGSLVVVFEDPAQSLDVAFDDTVHGERARRERRSHEKGEKLGYSRLAELDIAQFGSELLSVVSLLVSRFPQSATRKAISVRH